MAKFSGDVRSSGWYKKTYGEGKTKSGLPKWMDKRGQDALHAYAKKTNAARAKFGMSPLSANSKLMKASLGTILRSSGGKAIRF